MKNNLNVNEVQKLYKREYESFFLEKIIKNKKYKVEKGIIA